MVRGRCDQRIIKEMPFSWLDDGGRGPRAKECRQPLGAGKGREMDSLLEPSERDETLMICIFEASKSNIRLVTHRAI